MDDDKAGSLGKHGRPSSCPLSLEPCVGSLFARKPISGRSLYRPTSQTTASSCAPWGGGTSASLLLHKQGPLHKQTCRGTEKKLEAIVAYTEVLENLKTVQSNPEKNKAEGGGKGDKDKDK